jgi:hydrogenase expression/formation protein HypD
MKNIPRWRQRYRVPIVVTGFEPLDILHGLLMTVQQLESGRAEVENQYARAVRREGNQPAQER